jgi:hypothetical protein
MSLPGEPGEDKPADLRGKREGSTVSREGYDFSQSRVEDITEKKFDFGPLDSQPVNVDQTLAKLFDTLSVECR